jgi:hypothetical protein
MKIKVLEYNKDTKTALLKIENPSKELLMEIGAPLVQQDDFLHASVPIGNNQPNKNGDIVAIGSQHHVEGSDALKSYGYSSASAFSASSETSSPFNQNSQNSFVPGQTLRFNEDDFKGRPIEIRSINRPAREVCEADRIIVFMNDGRIVVLKDRELGSGVFSRGKLMTKNKIWFEEDGRELDL